MTSVAVAFDFEDVLPTILRAHSRANRDDAEEAIQVAVAERIEEGHPLTAPLIVNRAKSRLIDMMRRRERRNSSLDAAAESDEDAAPRELAVETVDFDSHVRLREARDNPVLRRKLELVEKGAMGKLNALFPRGCSHRESRYSDETVEAVRAMKDRGATYPEVAEAFGIPQSTIEKWVRREKRATPTMPGWTPDLVLTAIEVFASEEGRRPVYADFHDDPRLPSPAVAERLYGGTAAALRAAGYDVKTPNVNRRKQ